jgi:hypothetical protein
LFRFLPVAAVALIAAILSTQTPAPNSVAALRARLAKTSDPVHRARLMGPLGDAEFQDIRDDAAEGNNSEALATLKQYRDEAQSCAKALDAKEPNAEKHPAGFKELQISVRASLRRVDDLLVGLTADEQQPFLKVRKELEQLDHHLFQELFPRQPVVEAPTPKPKS